MATYGPGPQAFEYIASLDLGFFGVVGPTDFIDGCALAELVGLTDIDAKKTATGVDPLCSLLKFIDKGVVKFFPMKNLLAWGVHLLIQDLYSLGCLYGIGEFIPWPDNLVYLPGDM